MFAFCTFAKNLIWFCFHYFRLWKFCTFFRHVQRKNFRISNQLAFLCQQQRQQMRSGRKTMNDDLWDCYFYDKSLKTFYGVLSGADGKRLGRGSDTFSSIYPQPFATDSIKAECDKMSFSCHAGISIRMISHNKYFSILGYIVNS